MQEISCVAPKADQIFSVDLQTINHVFLQNMFEMASLSSNVSEHCERKEVLYQSNEVQSVL